MEKTRKVRALIPSGPENSTGKIINADMRAYKEAGANTLEMTNKKDGKVTITGKIVVSEDGKSRTVTISGTDAKGTKMESTAVYDKG